MHRNKLSDSHSSGIIHRVMTCLNICGVLKSESAFNKENIDLQVEDPRRDSVDKDRDGQTGL